MTWWRFLTLLYHWQTLVSGALTLVTGLLALLAAAIAARPAWRQLKSLNLQMLVVARELLHQRAETMENRSRLSRNAMAFLVELKRNCYDFDGSWTAAIDTIWAHSAEQESYDAVEKLTEAQRSSLDSPQVDKCRDALINRIQDLARCLGYIHAPESIEFGGEDMPTEEERPSFISCAQTAEAELQGHLRAVDLAFAALDQEFQNAIAALRDRIRRIDREAIDLI